MTTPPTDRPLTAGDVPLLRKGDVLRVVVAAARNEEWDGVKQPAIGEEVVFIKPSGSGGVSNCIVTSFDPTFGYRPGRFTFIRRPATSAASDEGVGEPDAWQCRIYNYQGEPGAWRECERPEDPTNLRPSRIIEFRPLYAALASPPSERERELEGALVDLVSWFTTQVHGIGRMVWVIDAGDQGADDAIKAARALTAQPAGEGK